MRRRPGRLGSPCARTNVIAATRLDTVLPPVAQLWLVHDPVVNTLQPMVPEAQGLLQEPDRRTRIPKLGPDVLPRTDERLAWTCEPLKQSRDRARVPVRPAADDVDGSRDRAVVLSDGALLPVVVSALVAQPFLGEKRAAFEPLHPDLPPVLANECWVRRPRVEGHHHGGPRQQIEGERQAADVVDIVGVAIVGRTAGDNRLQLGRPMRRNLQAVEATPRDTHHPDVARAPCLRGNPLQDLEAIQLLLRVILIEQDTGGIAATANIYAHAGVAVAGKPRITHRVVARIRIAFPIRDILQDRWYRLLRRCDREPEAGSKDRSVGKWDLDVVADLHLERKISPNPRSRVLSHSDHPFAICRIRVTSCLIWIDRSQSKIAYPPTVFLPQRPQFSYGCRVVVDAQIDQ